MRPDNFPEISRTADRLFLQLLDAIRGRTEPELPPPYSWDIVCLFTPDDATALARIATSISDKCDLIHPSLSFKVETVL